MTDRYDDRSHRLIDPIRSDPLTSFFAADDIQFAHFFLLLNSIASKTKNTTTKTKNTAATMPRKAKSIVGHRRKNKSNTTTTTTPNNAAKRSKIVDESGILQGITALLRKMDQKDLLAVMAHVVTTLEDKTKQTILQPAPVSVTATAAEGATATATVNSTTTTTTEALNPTTEVNHPATRTTTVPPSPQDHPPVVELTNKTRPPPRNIVKIDPHCFHCDGRTELEG
eukprot:CAMPEP_0201141478 /NCGR_PEP_ID=MMETSP0851-20130426/3121_1 /ASSEMBLY_ACC=CAM_ASM_000631 /TAXON_ID=183588 /ORGANISM="Pseudo-nitzschia fraudulenta, Strain WWA7" /LENGTH=225 /DNA_ID=CAMNT_0047414643 /DNA_START=229 /DNA_END=904 /DNA_ORIENTATION=-